MKCTSCKKRDAALGKKSCDECLEKARQRSSNQYKKRKTEKKCCSCDGKVTKGTTCEQCKLKKKNDRENRKVQGLCVTCGKQAATNGLKCIQCYKTYVKNVAFKKEKRVIQGLCAYCNKEQVGSSQMCLDHYLKATSRSHFGTTKNHKELYDLFLEQNEICPYTKRKLTLGDGTSVDHIVPKSRGGSLDISNLQWVSTKINFMKQDMLHEEFLAEVKVIYENYLQS